MNMRIGLLVAACLTLSGCSFLGIPNPFKDETGPQPAELVKV